MTTPTLREAAAALLRLMSDDYSVMQHPSTDALRAALAAEEGRPGQLEPGLYDERLAQADAEVASLRAERDALAARVGITQGIVEEMHADATKPMVCDCTRPDALEPVPGFPTVCRGCGGTVPGGDK